MKTLLIILVTSILFLYLITLYFFLQLNELDKKSDYKLDLDKDVIHITTKHNTDTTIYFDDLEEYIIMDNM